MITLDNYKEKTADFNFDLLPSKFKEGHKYITDYGDLYNDDADIKEVIDLYLTEVNKVYDNFVKKGDEKPTKDFLKEHVIVARVPKVEEKKVEEVKPEPKKAKVKPAKTPKSERNKKKVAEKKSKRETKKEKQTRVVNAEQFIKDLEAQPGKLKGMSEMQIIKVGLEFEKTYRSGTSQKRDESHDGKKRLSPTPENLLRWMKHPGHFDLIGVDTFERIDPTADYKKEISKQKFWNNVYGIKLPVNTGSMKKEKSKFPIFKKGDTVEYKVPYKDEKGDKFKVIDAWDDGRMHIQDIKMQQKELTPINTAYQEEMKLVK